jgi:hypothetical protein
MLLRALLALMLMVFSTLMFADNWTKASSLKGTRQASEADRSALLKELDQIAYNFEKANFLIHDGDLVIDGNFDCDTLLVVRGDLTVKGLYNDYRGDIGVLVVDGNMSAQHLYSWGALYVKRDLNVAGLAMAVYNDFTFEVGGKVNARALVISDKQSDYTAGRIDVELNDDGGIDKAVRHFVPEVFTQTDHFEPEFDDDFYGLSFDEGEALERIGEDLPVFRTTPAAQSLDQEVQRAMKSELSDAQQQSLANLDPLLAQLIAARPKLSDATAKMLLARNDPIISAWLAGSKPELVRTQSKAISPQLAESLAKNPETSLASIAQLAQDPNAAVRVMVAQYQALPDSDAGRTLIKTLINDADATVRASTLSAFGYASNFGLKLDDASIDARIADSDSTVRLAAVQLSLNAKQARVLLAGLNEEGRTAFAAQLRLQAEQRMPTRLTRQEITELALKMLVTPDKASFEQVRINTEAFLALPGKEQAAQMPKLLAARVIDPDIVARDTTSRTVMRQIADFAMTQIKMIPENIAENPFVPEDLQLKIVELARTAKAKSDDDYGDHPMDALEELLGNDYAAESALNQAVDIALKQGIAPADGGFQNALFHNRFLPQTALAKLDQKLDGDEDWALTLLLQKHATVSQHVRALKRWYDDDQDLQQSLKGAEGLDEAAFYQRAAQSASKDLQEIAVQNLKLPLNLVKLLQSSTHEEIARAASMHTQIDLKQLDLTQIKTDNDLTYLPRHDAKDWLSLSQSLSSTYLRAIAYQRYGDAVQRAED